MKHDESNLQAACVRWFRLQYPTLVLFSVPNGGWRNKITAAIMKREGAMAGVADLFLSVPNKYYHGLYIEMKTRKGTQSDAQHSFQSRVEAVGYKYVLCRNSDEFVKEINNYLTTD